MKDTDVPQLFPVPFGNSAAAGDIEYPIPTAAQPGGRASLTEGFPPVTFIPVAAGGIPPWGKDGNGIMFWTSAWSRWGQSGGPVKYSAAHQANIGGYPRGAIVASAVTNGLVWMSTVNDNATNPDALGAGWTPLLVPRGNQYFGPGGPYFITVLPGVDVMYADGCGAGGGGGGAFNPVTQDMGAGGGGGERRSGYLTVVPGEVLTIQVGIGGAGGNTFGSTGFVGSATTITGSVSGLVFRANPGTGGAGAANIGIGPPTVNGGFGGGGGARSVSGGAGSVAGYIFTGGQGLWILGLGGACDGRVGTPSMQIGGAPPSQNGNAGAFPGVGGTGALGTGTGGAGYGGELWLFWGNYG